VCSIRHVPEHTEPGEVLAGSIGFLISKLGMTSAHAFAETLSPLGIDPRHFGILRIIAMSEGPSQQRLGEALAVPPSRMVALIDDVEERGLVERRRNPTDRRAHAIHLTAKGRKLYDRAVEKASAFEDELCAGLSEAERAQLLDLLRRLAVSQSGVPVGSHPGLGGAEPPAH
jgi:DNA-binding MarR family transcriptional regulator